jgi:hypothetical protein
MYLTFVFYLPEDVCMAGRNVQEFIIQSEHKVFPWLQTFVTRKLRGMQTYFLSLLKLVSKILCHVFIVMLQLHGLLVSKNMFVFHVVFL